MAGKGQSSGLRTIFSFFLGLMFTLFVSIGVYTFHPPPSQYDAQIKELKQSEQEIRASRSSSELTAEEHSQLEDLRRQRMELVDANEEARKPWLISSSIILIVFSTLALVVSLVRSEQLHVISNGLLLGGVFTMLYGVGWIAFTGTSVIRFLVMTVALVITVGLGYIRFVRRSKISDAVDGLEILHGTGLTDIEHRISDLEDRMDNAAKALGKNNN
ncbi:MAG: hypothetical protein GY752_00275 [bacterium]|nr:hypothetical protein [bacterium]MCP4801089.1 hypothetical protein [bacterium]